MNTPREALNDPQLRDRSVVDTNDERSSTIGYPAEVHYGFSGAAGEAPELGEQTSEVLGRFGFEQSEIDALYESGAVGAS